jgi:hypothetical protein
VHERRDDLALVIGGQLDGLGPVGLAEHVDDALNLVAGDDVPSSSVRRWRQRSRRGDVQPSTG